MSAYLRVRLLLLVMNLIGLGLGPTFLGAVSDYFRPSHPGNGIRRPGCYTLVPLTFSPCCASCWLARALTSERAQKRRHSVTAYSRMERPGLAMLLLSLSVMAADVAPIVDTRPATAPYGAKAARKDPRPSKGIPVWVGPPFPPVVYPARSRPRQPPGGALRWKPPPAMPKWKGHGGHEIRGPPASSRRGARPRASTPGISPHERRLRCTLNIWAL